MIFRKPFTQILLPSVFSVTISATLISLSGCSFATNEHVKSNKKKPNFVWLISEDNSHHYLAHFFAGGAKTPAIEKLAREGITYTNAYSNAPVCSVARTTLQTGIYAPKIGAQFHRPFSTVSRPSKTKMIHEYLRDSGYYVTNKSKTDYNINVKARRTWDDSTKKSSWKNRKHPDQPFFHMETIFLSHESSLHFDDEYYQKNKDEVNLDLATLPPYLPDTPINRFTHLHYLSKLEQVDAKIATIVDSLKTDGVLEDTFIFYFADHGGVLPRGKGYLYESGLHVPLVVRIPENFKHLFPSDSGSTLTGTVEFVDFTPTLLKLAALPVPDFLDGEAFLGSGISAKHFNKRQESFGYADRFDEKYDLVRSLKVGRFHYIRSYQPYLPDGLFNSYRYKMLSYREWSRLNKSTHLPSVQRTFFNAKPVEMLFDTDVDPHEVNNLATNPKYLSTLKDLRTRLEAKLIQLPDLGFLPESYLAEKNIDRPLEFSIASQVLITELVEIANWQLLPFGEVKNKLAEALNSSSELHVYWALITAMTFGQEANALTSHAEKLMRHKNPRVKFRAIAFLGHLGNIDPQPLFLSLVNETNNPVFAVEVLNEAVYFQDHAPTRYQMNTVDLKPSVKNNAISKRINYLAKPKKTI